MNSNERLMNFMHLHNSCTRNGHYFIPSNKTGTVHNERMLPHTVINTFKTFMGGKKLKHSEKCLWRPNDDCFHNYGIKLITGKLVLPFGASPFLFIFVALSFFVALFALFQA